MSSLPSVVTVRTQTRHYTPSDRPWLLGKSAAQQRGPEDEETNTERLDNRNYSYKRQQNLAYTFSRVSVGVKFVTTDQAGRLSCVRINTVAQIFILNSTSASIATDFH